MLVGNNLSKPQFTEIMSCVRQLLERIEITKLASLPDAIAPEAMPTSSTGEESK